MKNLILLMILGSITAAAQVIDKSNAIDPTSAKTPSSVPVTSAPMRRVTMLLSATDKSGFTVKDFGKDSITVIDNDQVAQVVDVRNANPLPIDVAIVLLASKSNFSQQQNAAVDLVRKIIRRALIRRLS